jgi:hypothetical protein
MVFGIFSISNACAAAGALVGICEGVTRAALEVVYENTNQEKVGPIFHNEVLVMPCCISNMTTIPYGFVSWPSFVITWHRVSNVVEATSQLTTLEGIRGLQALLEKLQLTAESSTTEPVSKACVYHCLHDERDAGAIVTLIDLVRHRLACMSL